MEGLEPGDGRGTAYMGLKGMLVGEGNNCWVFNFSSPTLAIMMIIHPFSSPEAELLLVIAILGADQKERGLWGRE